MGWRFRKSFKIIPGVRLNVGSKGVTSLSLGGRGVTLNLGKRGTTTTLSLLGTGLSYRTYSPRAQPGHASITVTPSPQAARPPSLPRPASTRRRPLRAYAFIGITALVTYFLLKPERPALPTRVEPVEATFRAPEEPRSSLQPRPAAVTSAAAATPGVVTPFALAHSAALAEAVTTTGANVRSSASVSGSIVRVLEAGTRVRVVGEEGAWRRVADPGGEPWGWVHRSILR
jgi:hypothetical protein